MPACGGPSLTIFCKSSHGQIGWDTRWRFPRNGGNPLLLRLAGVVPVLYPDSRYRPDTALEFMRCIHSTPLHKPYLYLPIPDIRPFRLPRPDYFPHPHPASRPPLAAYIRYLYHTCRPALVLVPMCKRFSVPGAPAPIRHQYNTIQYFHRT